MEDLKYADSYSKVLSILQYISLEEYNKIPKSKLELFEKNYNKDYIIVISVGEALTKEMSKNLEALGLTYYIALDDDLRQALKADTDLHEKIDLVTKTGVNLNDLLDRIRDESVLLKECYTKLNQIEKRMNKLETFMREEEICRLNTNKILKLLQDIV